MHEPSLPQLPRIEPGAFRDHPATGGGKASPEEVRWRLRHGIVQAALETGVRSEGDDETTFTSAIRKGGRTRAALLRIRKGEERSSSPVGIQGGGDEAGKPERESRPTGQGRDVEMDALESEARPLARAEYVPRDEQEVQGSLQRLERDVKIADALERLASGGLNGFAERDATDERGKEALAERRDFRNRLAATLEGRAWHRHFTQLEPGDALICVMTPSSLDRFGMKSLNDDLVWRSSADGHIDVRRGACRDAFADLGVPVRELEQGYKDGYFRIARADLDAAGGAEMVVENLKEALSEVNAHIREDLSARLESSRASAQEDRARLLDDASAHIGDYRVTLGVTEVRPGEQDGNYAHIEQAILDAQKASQIARESVQASGGIRRFSPEEIPELLNRIAALRERLEKEEIVDANDRSYAVFLPNVDGIELNLDLVREVRKRSFRPSPGHTDMLHDIETYIGLVNILDPGKKPFTHEEISGLVPIGITKRMLKEQLALTERLTSLLRSSEDISKSDAETIHSEIIREGHDRSVTSRIEFSRQALALPEATYVTVDAVDVGPRQLIEFDRALAGVAEAQPGGGARISLFTDASFAAGDEMTRALREFRAAVDATYRKRFCEIHGGEEPSAPIPPMAVGGDEATIVVSDEVATPAFLLALRAATDARVTKNAVGVSARGEEPDGNQRKRAHIEALKRSEAAAERAKIIEKLERRIRADLRELSPAERGSVESQLNELRLSELSERGRRSTFAVVEQPDGTYELIRPGAEGGEESIKADSVMEELRALGEQAATQIRSACTRLINDERLEKFHLNLRTARFALRYLNVTEGTRVTTPAFQAYLHCIS